MFSALQHITATFAKIQTIINEHDSDSIPDAVKVTVNSSLENHNNEISPLLIVEGQSL